MITLAFTQMLYYLGISIEEYGGDDGLRLAARSRFPGLTDLRDSTVFYYVVLGLLLLLLLLGRRLVDARFGMVIRAARSNEARARAVGFSPYRYKLTAFALAGAGCGLAGALLDSILGATVQERRWCPRCEIATERRIHRCGTSTSLRGGLGAFDNDLVNLTSVLAGGVVTWALA